MGSPVTQGNKWSFPSAFCISPFITFLWPTFKILSPSILFYSGVTFRCRDVYDSGQNISVQLGFTGEELWSPTGTRAAFSTPSDHVWASTMKLCQCSGSFVCTKWGTVVFLWLIHLKIICGTSLSTEITRCITQIIGSKVWRCLRAMVRGYYVRTVLSTTGWIIIL